MADEIPKIFRLLVPEDPDSDLPIRVQRFSDGKLEEVALEELTDDHLAALEAFFTKLGEESEH